MKTLRMVSISNVLSGRSLAVVAAAALAAVPMVSQAQAVDAFDTAITTLTGKVEGYGGALVTFAAVAIAFYIAIKFVKKIPKAA